MEVLGGGGPITHGDGTHCSIGLLSIALVSGIVMLCVTVVLVSPDK